MPPAARLGDMHVCPMIDPGPKPHVGGPILPPCFPQVLIGFQPAARVGDMCTCVGPPDSIAMGSPTVLIGNMMAARMGDPTMHAGSIVIGFPTVDIGVTGMGSPATVAFGPPTGPPGVDPSTGTKIGEIAGMPVVRMPDGTIRVGNHIVIQGTPQFQAQVLSDLAIIANTPSSDPTRDPAGLTTLSNINNGRHDVTITQTAGGNVTRFNGANAANPSVGSPSTIGYNSAPRPTAANPSINRPGDVALHHELGHADHAQAGQMGMPGPPTNPNNPDMEEETNIGRDNQYRDDRGIPRRADHTVI